MFVRVLQLIAVTLYLVGAIAFMAYFGYSPFWLIPVLAPALYYLFTLPEVPGYGAKQHQKAIEKRVLALKKDPSNAIFVPLVEKGYLLTDEQIAQKKRRIAELEAVPHRRKYVAQFLQGHDLTDAQIDYLEDQGKLILCSHLRPVEAAWKSQGVRLWPQGDGSVRSPLNIDWPGIRDRFQLPETVIYEEVPGDRFGPPTQTLYCTVCRSRLESA